MNIVQSLLINNYNDNDDTGCLKYQFGYYSPEIHWLAFSLSCLLIKKYHPERRMLFYGNKVVVKLLLEIFKLPYDNGGEISCPRMRAGFYAWGKFETFKKQEEPYVHIDNDIFIGNPLPAEIFNAELITQHEERDSTFYKRVLKHLISNNIIIPDYLSNLLNEPYVPSFNHGLFGGSDLDFIGYYLGEVEKFLDRNHSVIQNIDRIYLLNVVYDQWLFYALCRLHQKRPVMYFREIVKDFRMPVNEVESAINFPGSNYLHLMNHKQNYRCNQMIIRKMKAYFPEYYERIVRYCYDNNQCKKIKYATSFTIKRDDSNVERDTIIYKRSKGYASLIFKRDDIHALYKEIGSKTEIIHEEKIFRDLYELDKRKMAFLNKCRGMKHLVADLQSNQQVLLEKVSMNEIDLHNCVVFVSPYTDLILIDSYLCKFILNNENLRGNTALIFNALVFTYNYFLDAVEEVPLRNNNRIYFDVCKKHINFSFVTNALKTGNKEQLIPAFSSFVKSGIFCNIICISQQDNKMGS